MLTGAQSIAAGTSHTCAVLATGGVRCWGNNAEGELGDGSTEHRRTPTPEVLSPVVAVTAGYWHTCALMANGKLSCFGRNDFGQHGDGTTMDRGAARHDHRLFLTAKRRMPESKPGLFDRAQRAEQRGNRDIRDLWQRYQGHRQQVTAAILALAPPGGGRVCLLGAGNANDLDLEQLAGAIRGGAPGGHRSRRAGARHRPPDAGGAGPLRSHAPVDVSGLYQQLARWDGSPAPLPTVQALVDTGAAAVLGQLPASGSTWSPPAACSARCRGRWSSCCHRTPATLALLQQALLRIHLRTLLALVQPVGRRIAGGRSGVVRCLSSGRSAPG